MNIRINKDIISGFYKLDNANDKNTFYLSKLKEENKGLISQLDKATKEKEDIRKKVNKMLYIAFTYSFMYYRKLQMMHIYVLKKKMKG